MTDSKISTELQNKYFSTDPQIITYLCLHFSTFHVSIFCQGNVNVGTSMHSQ